MEWWSNGGSRFEGQGVLLPGHPGHDLAVTRTSLNFVAGS